jgi:hypothetical protein
MNKRTPQHDMVSRALAVLEPPPAERESCRKLVEVVLKLQKAFEEPETLELKFGLNTSEGRVALARYVTALRKVRVCQAELSSAMQRSLAVKASAIEEDVAVVTEILTEVSRPGKRPPNKRALYAAKLAWLVLLLRRCELTTEREGKWHLLSQVFAETNRDIRHHLTASLLSLADMAKAEDEAASRWRKTQKR